jgi:hypothetical protein
MLRTRPLYTSEYIVKPDHAGLRRRRRADAERLSRRARGPMNTAEIEKTARLTWPPLLSANAEL